MKPILNFISVGILVLVMITMPINGKGEGTEKQRQEIIEVLKKLQVGYDQRDLTKVDEYAQGLFDPEDCLVIGIESSGTKAHEWFEGIEGVKKLLELDWKYWDDLKMKIGDTRIRIDGNTAWLVVPCTSENHRKKKEVYDIAVRSIARTLEANKDDKSDEISREILLWVTQHSSRFLWEYEQQNDEFLYPLRIMAVLVKKKGKWLFRQMSFAFPTRGIPDVRINKKEKKK